MMTDRANLARGVRIGLLDLLRALAITFVVITHYKNNLLPGGSIGVSIFFCLSGFLITQNLLDRNVSIVNFLIRRIFRIYPTYVVVIFLHLCILYLTSSPILTKYTDGLADLLLIIKMPDEWLGFGVGVLWTLQIELWFYFLIPFLIKKTSSWLRIGIVSFLILISFILKTLAFLEYFKMPGYSICSMLFWMDNLLYGTLIALALNNQPVNISPENLFSKKYSLKLKSSGIFVILLTVLLIAYFVPSTGKIWPFESSLVSALTALVIYLSLKNRLYESGMPKIVSYISLLAYTIYLAHPFPHDYYEYVESNLHFTKLGSQIVVLTLLPVLILTLHFFVEKPGMVLGRKILALRV